MIDLSNGTVKIAEGLSVYPNYLFEEFKKTSFYEGQDGIRIIYLHGQHCIDGRNYAAYLFFRDGKLYMLSLLCCDKEYSEADEMKRKELHDEILKQYGVIGEKEFVWGRVTSNYDGRGNVSSIQFIYF